MDLLGFGSGLLDTLVNGANARQAQSSAQDFAAQQFQTRYQTTVKDMEAAGLSPMLAYSNGASGAPGGSPVTSTSNIAGAMSANRLASAQEAQIEAQTENIKADTGQKAAQTALWLTQQRLNNASAQSHEDTHDFYTRTWDQDVKNKTWDTEMKNFEYFRQAQQHEFDKSFGDYMPYVKAIGTLGSSAQGALDAFGSLIPSLSSFRKLFGGKLPNAKP